MPIVVGADRSYVKQTKDPQTALRLSQRPNADWIRLLILCYSGSATGRRRQISVSGDRLFVHAKIDEVAEHLIPAVLTAVDEANRRYADQVEGSSERPQIDIGGDRGAAIERAMDAIDAAIARARDLG